MEIFNENKLRGVAYQTISQSGKGMDMDRYIYSMQGEGLGSFFGNLVKTAIPILGKAIKGAAKIIKPHAIAAGKELITTGSKRGATELNKKLIHNSHRRKRKRTEWQSL